MNSEDIILISGCPRSGTSWIHFLIAAHPDTFTVRETHLYDKYIGPLKSWFDNEGQLKGQDGLSAIFSEQGFIDNILGPMVHSTFSEMVNQAEKHQTVVEKTPGNILHHRLVREIQPNARLLFVVRDPRAVYASYKAGSTQNWGSWMKKSVAEFCSSWNKYASAYLSARHYWPKERLKMIKYEDLKHSGEAKLVDLYLWAGLDIVDGVAERALTDNSIERLKHAEKGTLHHEYRNDFYRSGKAYGWVEELSLIEIKEVEKSCADLMSLFGYQIHTPK